MNEAIAFDTRRFVRRLTESGFTERQAETLAEENIALLNANLASKTGIEALRQETGADVEALKADLLKWLCRRAGRSVRADRRSGQAAVIPMIVDWNLWRLPAESSSPACGGDRVGGRFHPSIRLLSDGQAHATRGQRKQMCKSVSPPSGRAADETLPNMSPALGIPVQARA